MSIKIKKKGIFFLSSELLINMSPIIQEFVRMLRMKSHDRANTFSVESWNDRKPMRVGAKIFCLFHLLFESHCSQMRSLESIELREHSFFISFSLSHLEEIIPKSQYLFKCWISFKLIIMRDQVLYSFTAYIWVWPFVINRSIKIINSVMTP